VLRAHNVSPPEEEPAVESVADQLRHSPYQKPGSCCQGSQALSLDITKLLGPQK